MAHEVSEAVVGYVAEKVVKANSKSPAILKCGGRSKILVVLLFSFHTSEINIMVDNSLSIVDVRVAFHKELRNSL